jgi:hypothetical protein
VTSAQLPAPDAALGPRELRDAAVAVLRANDVGGWTRPAPRLYPHQWSWDSAFIAIGLAHVDPDRALGELERLFRAQWRDGRVPHIVFDARVRDYFPGPDLWASAETSADAPRKPATSGLIQPPMHAIAVWRIWQTVGARASDSFVGRVRALYPGLLAWHRYLAHRRDPEHSGLLTVYHPWEGTDNTPRWDAALARLDVGDVPPYARYDTSIVGAPERPTKAEYDRYLWLVGLLRSARYDDDAIQRAHPFLIRDVQCSAIFAAANECLLRVAERLGAPADECAEIDGWRRAASEGVRRHFDSRLGLALDYDVRARAPVPVRTSAGLSALLVSELEPSLVTRLVETAFGPDFAGAPGLAYPVVVSTSPRSPEFRPRAYWRGPAWPVVNWLLWWALTERGLTAPAAALRAANLALLARPEARFAEYFEPYTAEPLGSPDQSWTAAVTLDWLAV